MENGNILAKANFNSTCPPANSKLWIMANNSNGIFLIAFQDHRPCPYTILTSIKDAKRLVKCHHQYGFGFSGSYQPLCVAHSPAT